MCFPRLSCSELRIYWLHLQYVIRQLLLARAESCSRALGAALDHMHTAWYHLLGITFTISTFCVGQNALQKICYEFARRQDSWSQFSGHDQCWPWSAGSCKLFIYLLMPCRAQQLVQPLRQQLCKLHRSCVRKKRWARPMQPPSRPENKGRN